MSLLKIFLQSLDRNQCNNGTVILMINEHVFTAESGRNIHNDYSTSNKLFFYINFTIPRDDLPLLPVGVGADVDLPVGSGIG